MLDLDALSTLVYLGLLVFCLIDCIQTPADEIRGLDKVWWLILIVLLPIAGGIAWLVAGRPVRSPANGWRMGNGFAENQRPMAARAPRGPDDDDEFLREMKQVNDEHEQTLNRWEADLRRREAEQRRREAEE